MFLKFYGIVLKFFIDNIPENFYKTKDAPEISVYHWFPKYAKEKRYIEIWLPIEKAER